MDSNLPRYLFFKVLSHYNHCGEIDSVLHCGKFCYALSDTAENLVMHYGHSWARNIKNVVPQKQMQFVKKERNTQNSIALLNCL